MAGQAPADPEAVEAMKAEVRELAAEREAVILAHNYQVPEVQDVADFVGDSLALSQQASKVKQPVIAFCGVHFMAETASILAPDKTVLLPDHDAGCSLADSITAEQLGEWQSRHPGAITVMYVNTTAAIKALTDYCCTSSNARAVVEHVIAKHGPDVEILFGPDMFLGAYVQKTTGHANMRIWDGECHVHAGIRPSDITEVRAEHPGAEFLIHPECGCVTSVMEYVVIVATETGMLYPLSQAAPDVTFIPANAEASCRYMKMITLEKLRDSLRDMTGEVKVPANLAERARLPIERMVSITG
jgi:quinolinate synthase